MKKFPRFVRDEKELAKLFLTLKQQRCPHCATRGMLNRHSRCYGNHTDTAQGQQLRGQEIYCSNRGRRTGCGRTARILFASVLPRHTFSATLLGTCLQLLVRGASIKSAWEQIRPGLSLESVYHILQRFRNRLDAVRAALFRCCNPPRSSQVDPLLQTTEHLRCAFPVESCPLSAFQRHFQSPLMG